jgi:hypothetical protein
MMMRVLLDGEAVEGETPTIWRKDWTAMLIVSIIVECIGCGCMYKCLYRRDRDTTTI